MTAPALARGRTGRRYIWPPNDNPDYVFPSVTTVLNNLNKPALPNWAAREVAKYAVENILQWQDLPPDDAVDLLKRAPHRNMKKKGDVGTAVHQVMEAWKLGETPELDLDETILPYVAGAAAYLNENVHRIVHVESTIFNTTYQYAGTCDAIVTLKTGPNVIVDWKTSNNVYPEHALQLVAYANGDFIGTPEGEAYDVPPIDYGHVVHLPGDGTYKAHKVPLTDRAFKTFVALRTLQKWRDDYESDALGDITQGPAA